jgi:acetyl esterase/lipase
MSQQIILRALLWSCLALLTLAVSSCFGLGVLMYRRTLRGGYHESWRDGDGSLQRGIIYDEASGNAYDLFIPAKASSTRNNGLMLFIHGGGWQEGQREHMHYACRRYAKHGYVCATLSYSLAHKDKPELTMFTMLDDIDKCIAHLKAKTAELAYPTQQIALSGASAGGHLAMLYAYSRGAKSPLPIAFVFQQTGPVDFHPDAWGDDAQTLAWLITAAVGKPISEEMIRNGHPEAETAIRSISPLAHIGSDTPPTIFAYGGRDALVRPLHGDRLGAALAAHGVPHQKIAYPRSDHMLYSDPGSAAAYEEAALAYARQFFAADRYDELENRQ